MEKNKVALQKDRTMKKITVLFIAINFTLPIFGQSIFRDTLKIGETMVVRNDAETLPSFISGERGWISFLEQNLHAGIAEANDAPVGTYYVQLRFVVDTKGSPANITPLTRCGFGMEKEAVRVLKRSVWKPGTINGNPVNAQQHITITFIAKPHPISIK